MLIHVRRQQQRSPAIHHVSDDENTEITKRNRTTARNAILTRGSGNSSSTGGGSDGSDGIHTTSHRSAQNTTSFQLLLWFRTVIMSIYFVAQRENFRVFLDFASFGVCVVVFFLNKKKIWINHPQTGFAWWQISPLKLKIKIKKIEKKKKKQ